MKDWIFAVALALLFLSGCQGRTSELAVREGSQYSGNEPIALEPDELQREAPAFYRLLEEAHDTGYASTQDKDEKEAVDDYLRTKNRSVPTYVEYRDKFFSVGLVG